MALPARPARFKRSRSLSDGDATVMMVSCLHSKARVICGFPGSPGRPSSRVISRVSPCRNELPFFHHAGGNQIPRSAVNLAVVVQRGRQRTTPAGRMISFLHRIRTKRPPSCGDVTGVSPRYARRTPCAASWMGVGEITSFLKNQRRPRHAHAPSGHSGQALVLSELYASVTVAVRSHIASLFGCRDNWCEQRINQIQRQSESVFE